MGEFARDARVSWSASLVVLLASMLGGGGLEAQAPGATRLQVEHYPPNPVQGSIFAITVNAGVLPVPRLVARMAGEPVRFQRREDGSFWGVGAVPLDAGDTLGLEIVAMWEETAERIFHPVVVTKGQYAMERLTVAPEYGEPLSPELVARTEAESARALAVARGAHETPPLWVPGDFVRPRTSRITSGFGNGREFNGQVLSRHTGTDLNGAVGDPVVAAAPGIVRLVDSFYLGGNVIYLDHGGGVSTGYLHLSETLVEAGDTVAAGQRIGSVGATGRVTGPHLHWILRFGAITVDPLSALDLRIP
jgi:murein DD-endopeptidase MepM/ murein hydrolase activator NlpD